MSNLTDISRRDFLAGTALSGFMLSLSPLEAISRGLLAQANPSFYPPALTGMRGSHPGSFEVAHAIAMEGKSIPRPDALTDSPYDLIVVGAGISGLAAALMAQERLGKEAKILILDNHDDFGGHAKRNEFAVAGKNLIGYGGSQSLDEPGNFSRVSAAFIRSLGIDTAKFYRYYDRSFFPRHGLRTGMCVGKVNPELFVRQDGAPGTGFFDWATPEEKADVAALIDRLPVSAADKKALQQLFIERVDWLAGRSRQEKIDYLRQTSYEECLRVHLGLSDRALEILRIEPKPLWGLGWDALSGLEAVRLSQPGTYGLDLDPEEVPAAYKGDEPYIFHFPDGNASIPRLAVAKLIPDALKASSMDDVVTAVADYSRLDVAGSPVRIRLSSTVVEARNKDGGVELIYVKQGKPSRVTARAAVMACWNHTLPHIMPEMESAQRDALSYAEKVPLTYVNVALTNWRAFEKAGMFRCFTPDSLFARFDLDFPVSMGGYRYSNSPEDPVLVHMVHTPTRPGLSAREQHSLGKHDMLALTFEDYENEVIATLDGALAAYGFDATRDIADITVNRWPHGYAYEYNELFDPVDWGPGEGPHIIGRQTIGNIAIANADSSAYSYVNGAIDAAARAVDALYPL